MTQHQEILSLRNDLLHVIWPAIDKGVDERTIRAQFEDALRSYTPPPIECAHCSGIDAPRGETCCDGRYPADETNTRQLFRGSDSET